MWVVRADVPRGLLADHEELATARLADPRCGDERTALHVLTDWPGHVPNGRAMVAMLVAAGADVDAAFGGAHAERPLHWAASSDDVEVLDALVEGGADLEAPGSVIDAGVLSPMPLRSASGVRLLGSWSSAARQPLAGGRARTQIALFVAPVLVLLSFAVGPFPMALVFNPLEIGALVLAALVAHVVTHEGESTWMDGLQLLALYVVLGLVFFSA